MACKLVSACEIPATLRRSNEASKRSQRAKPIRVGSTIRIASNRFEWSSEFCAEFVRFELALPAIGKLCNSRVATRELQAHFSLLASHYARCFARPAERLGELRSRVVSVHPIMQHFKRRAASSRLQQVGCWLRVRPNRNRRSRLQLGR